MAKIIYLQPFAVLDRSERSEAFATGALPTGYPGGYGYIVRTDASVPAPAAEIPVSSQVLRTTFSSVPFLWQTELGQEYQELGETLSQLAEQNDVDDWGIEPPVYGTACFVAAELLANRYPAPRVFTHGSKSVVFNWSQNDDNLYLTITGDRISALVSSPERIKRRIEFSRSELISPESVLHAIQSVHPQQSTPFRLTASVSDPLELAH